MYRFVELDEVERLVELEVERFVGVVTERLVEALRLEPKPPLPVFFPVARALNAFCEVLGLESDFLIPLFAVAPRLGFEMLLFLLGESELSFVVLLLRVILRVLER